MKAPPVGGHLTRLSSKTPPVRAGFKWSQRTTYGIVPVAEGGSDDQDNLIHLHAACWWIRYTLKPSQRLEVRLEQDDGKLSRLVLRGEERSDTKSGYYRVIIPFINPLHSKDFDFFEYPLTKADLV